MTREFGADDDAWCGVSRRGGDQFGGDKRGPHRFSARAEKKTPSFPGVLWWAQQDLNLRLLPCEGNTLPLSYAPSTSSRSSPPFGDQGPRSGRRGRWRAPCELRVGLGAGAVVGTVVVTPSLFAASLGLAFVTLCVGHSVGLRRGVIRGSFTRRIGVAARAQREARARSRSRYAGGRPLVVVRQASAWRDQSRSSLRYPART